MSKDQDILIALMYSLDKNITLQLFVELMLVVIIVYASGWAIACVLEQLNGVGIQKLDDIKNANNVDKAYRDSKQVMFLSKVLNNTQGRWSQTEKEAYSVYWFLLQN